MPTIQEAVIQAVRTILDDEDFDVSWERRKSEFRNDMAHVQIQVLGIRKFGAWDELRTSQLPDGSIQERLFGIRSIRLQFTVHTDDQNFSASALDLADRIRSGLDRSDIHAYLDTADIAVSTVTDVRDVSGWDRHNDDRSIAVFEVAFNGNRITTGPIVPPIAAVEVTATVTGTQTDPFTVGPTMIGTPYEEP